ncbi:MAG: hypothetical protein QNJ54_31110 [Prochloraceae cyanobacterium]|nr:hypothetical protein [Prochloraceae cyanobacterium]
MINLDPEERLELIKIIASIPEMQSYRGRRQILEQAGLSEFIPRINLAGATGIVVGEIVSFLASYGYNDKRQAVLGVLLNSIKSYVGYEQITFLNKLLSVVDKTETKKEEYIDKETFKVILSLPQNQENLRWQELKTIWKQSCGGELSEPIALEDYWSLTWSHVERQKLLDEVERGELDRELARLAGQHILEILHNSECLYQFVPPAPLKKKRIRAIGLQETQDIASKVDVLLLTVTDPEREAVLSVMSPLPGEEEILQGSIAQITYRFGLFGNYYVAQTESTMGSSGRAGSLSTTMQAINELKPKAVLLLGIAFGVNRNKQRLCDVLVAESIFSYELQKIQGGIIINRGRETPCGLTLSERFRNRRQGWELPCGRRSVQVHQGLVLSGDKLVNDKDFRDRLIANFPFAVGGEMEGAGAYEAAERARDTEIILIKAICDWADGSKNDRAQPYAAYAAVSLAHYVLSQPDVLSALGVPDVPLAMIKQKLDKLSSTQLDVQVLGNGSIRILGIEVPYYLPEITDPEALKEVEAWKKVHSITEDFYSEFFPFEHRVIHFEDVLQRGTNKDKDIQKIEASKDLATIKYHITRKFNKEFKELPEAVRKVRPIDLIGHLPDFFQVINRYLGSIDQECDFEIVKELTTKIRELLLHVLHQADRVLEDYFDKHQRDKETKKQSLENRVN